MNILKTSRLLEELSLFELFGVEIILRRILNDHLRIDEVRKILQAGQTIRYFEPSANEEIFAVIIKLGRSYAWVLNHHDNKKWKIPYYMINTNHIKFDLDINLNKIDKFNLKIGEHVGYLDRNNLSTYGKVIKVNEKTASVKIASGQIWRVPYSILFRVMDGTTIEGNLELCEPCIGDQD